MVATAAAAAAAAVVLHCPLLSGEAVWDSRALCERGGGVQRLSLPDGD